MSRSYHYRPNKYQVIVLYRGEAFGDDAGECFEFTSLQELYEWLFTNGYSKNIAAARTGIHNLLFGKIPHYKGFTVAVAFNEGYHPDPNFPRYNILPEKEATL